MVTVFDSLNDGFYMAFFEPDPDKRREKIDLWIEESVPVIQSAIENDLKKYIESILQGTWTFEGWKQRFEKFSKNENGKYFFDKYKLNMSIEANTQSGSNVVGDLTSEMRIETIKAIEEAKNYIAKEEPPSPTALKEIDLHGNTVEEALPKVEQFIKECYRDNVRRVRIIHGKGIFVLQKVIREYFKTHEYIKHESIKSADKDHGGEGATEANLIDFSTDKFN